MTKFDNDDDVSSDLCDLAGSFDFCMVVTDESTGDTKKHFFDEKENVAAIMGNYKRVSNERTKYTWRVYDKGGEPSTAWKELL